MEKQPLKIQVQTLPQSAGVYQFYDSKERVIYVGKAKNLKKRVSSYFNKNHTHGKTKVLVKNISRIKHIVVKTETDALLLENNLIKKYQPKYNVLLKDDKSYPWICIKNEPFPRVFSTRKLIKDGSEYFGPYTSGKTVSTLLGLIRALYPLRTCRDDLSAEKVQSGKYKVCLEFHIGNCNGACEGKEREDDYAENIKAIRNILRGDFKDSLNHFREQMNAYAKVLKFELAQKTKEKVAVLENYQAKSTIVNPKISNVDVFSIVSDQTYGYVNFLQLSHGAITRSHTLEIKKNLGETNREILSLAITEIRQRFNSLSKEIYVPFKLSVGESIKVTTPKKGDKKRLISLSERNAKYFRLERLKQIKILDPEKHTQRIMAQMKKDLRLEKEPRHMECFDNSNIQGSAAVGACVVFKDGKPSKKDYRHFNIKTVLGPDDFASMEEVVYRRYKRLLEENQPLPQLIVIDGGKGQISSALKSLDRLQLKDRISVIGIAKKLEEIFYPSDPIPLYLDKKSETLKVIQQLRNEAHRFGIQHHRNKRSKTALETEIEAIPGIGKNTALSLLRRFKSVKRIREAKREELIELIGKHKAEIIYTHFQRKHSRK